MYLILMKVSRIVSRTLCAWAWDIRRRFLTSCLKSLAFFCRTRRWLYISGVSCKSAEMFNALLYYTLIAYILFQWLVGRKGLDLAYYKRIRRTCIDSWCSNEDWKWNRVYICYRFINYYSVSPNHIPLLPWWR